MLLVPYSYVSIIWIVYMQSSEEKWKAKEDTMRELETQVQELLKEEAGRKEEALDREEEVSQTERCCRFFPQLYLFWGWLFQKITFFLFDN